MKRILLVLMVLLMSAQICLAEIQRGGPLTSWIGLSTDTKPASVDSVRVGWTFKESDTGLLYYANESYEWILDAIEVVIADTLTASGDTLTTATAGFDEVTFALESGGAAIANYAKFKGKIGGSGYGNIDGSADSTLVDGTETILQSYKEAASLDRIMLEASTISTGDTLFVWIKKVNRFKR